MTCIAYLDLIGGVAGDMLIAGLIDAGASATTVFGGLEALGLAHREPHLEEVLRGGFRALHLAGTPATGQQPRTLSTGSARPRSPEVSVRFRSCRRSSIRCLGFNA
jgi:uncharacterized protein (DUF111 family)